MAQKLILSMHGTSKEPILCCDASQTGIGGVLKQVGEYGREHLISYYSRKFLKEAEN